MLEHETVNKLKYIGGVDAEEEGDCDYRMILLESHHSPPERRLSETVLSSRPRDAIDQPPFPLKPVLSSAPRRGALHHKKREVVPGLSAASQHYPSAPPPR